MMTSIKNIFKIFDNNQKKKFYILIFLMIISMILEILGIASLIPLINFFLKNDLIFFKQYIEKINLLANFSLLEIISLVIFFIILFFLIKNLYLAFYYWFESKIIYKIRFDLGIKLFKQYVNKPYSYHVESNSSNLLSKIIQKAPSFGSAIMSLASFFSNSILLIGIFLFLFIIRPLETFLILLIIFFLSFIFFFLIKKKIFNIGKKTEEIERERVRVLQESFGGIKEINIYNAQNQFISLFAKLSDRVANIGFIASFFQKVPKVWFEVVIIFTTFSLLFYNLFFNFNNERILITLSIFLISSIKILPSVSAILIAVQNIKFSENSLINILKDLDADNNILQNQQILKNHDVIFKNEIKFFNVSFYYSNSNRLVIKDCNISIKKNDFICILGETGSGKSTFVDLLTSLVSPTNGKILVDNVDISENIYSWKNKISYVPQHPFLLDASIKENIIFYNNHSYSEEKFNESLNKAELNVLINRLPNGVDSVVGEKGAKISGGEKQRISIARAIYNDSEIIIFDESTNALDSETEKKIMNTIIKFKGIKTVIFITHKNDFLSMFDRKFKLENKTIIEE
jgi:ABC-type multidrug transport system fused ATPase/permease subunit